MRCVLGFCVAAALLVDSDTLDLKERPVTKVINLLKEMQANLEKEGAADQELFDKLSCWCTTNEKDKTAAVEEAQRRITSLVSAIQAHAGKSAQLKAEVAQHEKDIQANQNALATAEEVRAKEHAEFNQSEKDMMQAIESLKNAVQVLSKHHESFLQSSASTTEVKAAVQSVLAQSLPTFAAGKLHALVQQPAGAGQSFAPQSGQIFGILNQMQDEFEANLSDAQKTEMRAASEFKELKSAKTKEIDAAMAAVKSKTQTLADADDQLAQNKEDLELTRSALAADREFLADLQKRCLAKDDEFDERTKTRTEEIAAVSETIKILADDDAHDNFAKTMNFAQKAVAGTLEVRRRIEAAKVLAAFGRKTGSALLLAASSRVQLDAFTEVKKAIDDMVGELKKEQADEVQQKDLCTQELEQNEKATARTKRELQELSTLLATSAATIEDLSGQIEALKKANAEMSEQMKAATEDRALERKDFQQNIADHHQTQAILKKALARMEAFYGQKEANAKANALMQGANARANAWLQDAQEPGADVEPMPEGFSEYKTSGGASGVLTLLQKVIDDSKGLEKDATNAEAEAQLAYEEFMANTQESTTANNKAISAKTEERAETESRAGFAKADKVAADGEAEAHAATNAQLHGTCDFLLKNFDLRQAAHTQEIEALQQAKAILSGADFAF